ncbi:MAG TPA: arsenate reductase (glutaredoxin) [Steroidobacteraceae bacterium]|jgi:arsenate reductase|nr:arsenate reductase (glutaredoxin) [Steroidobacteraceae bacterium]
MDSGPGSSRAAVTIYHNPACSNSRGALTLIRNAGLEPTIIEYLKTPPDRATLLDLLGRMGARPRDIMRQKEPRYAELGLGSPEVSDEQLVEAMLAHPLLINRPIVVTPLGARLCRPPEVVLDLLPQAQG